MTDKELLKQALEYLQDNQHWVADGERHAYVMEYNAFIDKLKQALAQPEQEPVAWEGGEGWESLAWELCADENGEDSCNELIWEGGPIPEPWGDRWMKYEEEAKRLIALVQKHTTPPQRTWVGLTDDERNQLWRDVVKWGDPSHDDVDLMKAIEARLRSKNT